MSGNYVGAGWRRVPDAPPASPLTRPPHILERVHSYRWCRVAERWTQNTECGHSWAIACVVGILSRDAGDRRLGHDRR